MPNYLSQSTIGGRMSGSNACTVIALLTGRHFLEGALAIPKELKDLSQTIPFYSKMIFKGNHIYNTFNLPANQPNLDVQNVLQQNHEEFQKIKIDADMGFVSTQHLEDFLVEYQNQHTKFAGVLIVPPDKSMLLCFDQQSTSLFESHTHGLQGGIISTSSSRNTRNFVRYLETMVRRDWQTNLRGCNIAIFSLK